MPAFESSGEVDTNGSTVTSIAISNVTLTGSNRSLYLSQSARFNSQNAGTPTRSGDTFTEVAEYEQTTGGGTLYVSLWFSTNEPGTSAQTLTFNHVSSATFGGQYINCTGVNQTTRYENLTRNTDELATSGMAAMDVSSNTGDLVLDMVAAINSATIGNPTGTNHTQRSASTFPSTSWAMKMGSTPGASTVSIGWDITGSTDCATHYAWSVPADTIPPTVTVPTGYIPTNNLGPRTISGISVTEGDDPITLVTLTCTLGKGTMTMTASGSSAVSGSGTNAISIIGGSETDINNTLATFAFTGLEPTRENVTVAILATDGTINDSENLVLFNHRTSLTIVADSYADLVAMIQTAKMILPVGSTSGQVEIVAEDDDTLTDTQTITLFVPSSIGSSGGDVGQARMFHYLGLGF